MEPNRPQTPNNPGAESPVPPPAYPTHDIEPPRAPETPPTKKDRNINIPIILAVVMLLVAIVFGALCIMYIQKYNKAQTNVNQERRDAATIAKQEQKQVDEKEFAERQKQPFRTYQAPAVLGAIKAEFPRDWNVYAIEDEKASDQLDIYMYPGIVRAPQSSTEPYAFRIRLSKQLYTQSLNKFQADIKNGTITASSVTVSGITGTKLVGEIQRNRSGVLILLPVRDKTLSLWTESNNYVNDFNGIIQRMSISP